MKITKIFGIAGTLLFALSLIIMGYEASTNAFGYYRFYIVVITILTATCYIIALAKADERPKLQKDLK